MNLEFLPYGRQAVDEADIASVVDVLRGDYLTTGPAVTAFEDDLAKAVDAPFAATCSNGTAALHLAALALGLKAGDTIVVPAVTFLATANAAYFVGADVVFADVDPSTGLMRPSDLKAALDRAAAHGKKVKAVFNVHLAGQCENLEEIAAIARAARIHVVDDACHAIGASWGGKPVGDCRLSDMTLFSFHPVKTVTSGEGGAVITRSEVLHERVRRFRNHGMIREAEHFIDHVAAFDGGSPNPWYYEMHEPGFNYRLTDIQAALGRSQLVKLPKFVARRHELAQEYDEKLAKLAPVIWPLARTPNCSPAWHLYIVFIDFAGVGLSRARVMNDLSGRGIGTQVHYRPLPFQPFYRSRDVAATYPGASSYYDHCLSLPLYPAMRKGDVDRVVSALEAVVRS